MARPLALSLEPHSSLPWYSLSLDIGSFAICFLQPRQASLDHRKQGVAVKGEKRMGDEVSIG